MSQPDQPVKSIRDALQSGRLTINELDDGSGVLLDLDGEQLMTLNATGMRLVRGIEAGRGNIGELRDLLCEAYEVDAARAEADAAAFVREIAEAL